MRKGLSIAVAASLAAAGFAFHVGQQPARAEDKPAVAADAAKTAEATEAAATPKIALPAGIKLKEKAAEADRTGILRTIDTLTEAAVTKDGFDDLVERLVDQDRNRIGKDGFAEKKFDDLNAKAEAIRTAWKAKYGSEFKIENDSLAPLATACGSIEDTAAIAGTWPVKAIAESSEAVTAAAKQPAPGAAANPNEDANLEKGRDVAVAAVPASHGLPTVNLSLIQELGGYKVDLPNTLTGQQLHDSLLKHLTHISDMQAQWPADVKDAQRMVVHHIALGVYGVDAEPTRGAAASDGSGTPSDAKDAAE